MSMGGNNKQNMPTQLQFAGEKELNSINLKDNLLATYYFHTYKKLGREKALHFGNNDCWNSYLLAYRSIFSGNIFVGIELQFINIKKVPLHETQLCQVRLSDWM